MYNNMCTMCRKPFNTEDRKNYLCKECRRAYNKRYYKERKKEQI